MIAVREPLYRLHGCHHHPCYFGKTGGSRFDAPAGEYGVLYLADEPRTAFIETFGHSTGVNIVTTAALDQRCLSRIDLLHALHLVDLTGPGLAQLGADNRLCTGDHQVAQRWSKALWSHPAQIDGIRYRARHDPSQVCVGLFDRAADAASPELLGRLLEPHNRRLLATILDHYAFGLLDASSGK
jgi:hypothetical protein